MGAWFKGECGRFKPTRDVHIPPNLDKGELIGGIDLGMILKF
jgi:hypothetical protein